MEIANVLLKPISLIRQFYFVILACFLSLAVNIVLITQFVLNAMKGKDLLQINNLVYANVSKDIFELQILLTNLNMSTVKIAMIGY